MSTPVERALLRDRENGTSGEDARVATNYATTSAPTNPFASASLVPMLVAGLVLIVVAMIVALAIS